MQKLNTREKVLLLLCFLVVFVVANLFAIRYASKNWTNQDDKIQNLTNELKDLELWLNDQETADTREQWLDKNIPQEGSMTKAQGDLLQSLQDDLFERKITIEKQSLVEPNINDHFREVAVSLKLRGEEKSVIKWLITLQGASKFMVIKKLKLQLDTKSKEELPQVVCEIVLARWFAPISEDEDRTTITPANSKTQSSTPPNQQLAETN